MEDNELRRKRAKLASAGAQLREKVIDSFSLQDLNALSIVLCEIIDVSDMPAMAKSTAKFIFTEGLIRIEEVRQSKTGKSNLYEGL